MFWLDNIRNHIRLFLMIMVAMFKSGIVLGGDTPMDLLNQISALKSQVAYLESKVQELERQNSEIVYRQCGNPGVTDLDDPDRPIRLGEKFSEFYDNQHTEALEQLGQTGRFNEEENVILLREIVVAFRHF